MIGVFPYTRGGKKANCIIGYGDTYIASISGHNIETYIANNTAKIVSIPLLQTVNFNISINYPSITSLKYQFVAVPDQFPVYPNYLYWSDGIGTFFPFDDSTPGSMTWEIIEDIVINGSKYKLYRPLGYDTIRPLYLFDFVFSTKNT